jgi:hypothetical protein
VKARTIKQRAAAYARGKRKISPADVEDSAQGWEDGYRAAYRMRHRMRMLPEVVHIAKERKVMAIPLQTKEERAKTKGRAFTYARALLLNPPEDTGRAPFSHIDAETIAQESWAAGYLAALRDVRKGTM